MGSCVMHPLTEVEQDLSVSYHTDVLDIVVFKGDIPWYQVLGCCTGLMYIKDGSLYYEMKCGSSLCCLCCRKRFKLQDLRTVEVIDNQAFRFQSASIRNPRTHEIVLSPGLRITAGYSTTVLVGVPEAVELAQQLRQACNLRA